MRQEAPGFLFWLNVNSNLKDSFGTHSVRSKTFQANHGGIFIVGAKCRKKIGG